MNWGYRIGLLYSAFALMIMYFLFVASKQSNELIEDHYYEKELQFQKTFDAQENFESLSTKPIIKIINSDVIINLPADDNTKLSNVKIKFIRYSDESMDVNLIKNNVDNNEIRIEGNKFYTGIYQLQIEWIIHGKSYMYKDNFEYYKKEI